MSVVRTVSGLVACMVFSWSPALAQSNAEVNAGIQFDFSLPGARSLSLGGAFVALADDASSTWANPAGLPILARPEVSFELRGWRFTNQVADRGHAVGSPTGVGFDNVPGLVDFESSSWTRNIAFLSYVQPAGRWSFGFYRHQLSDFRAVLQSSGPFLDRGGDVDRVDPFTGNMDLGIANYGASAGYHVAGPLFLGAGLSVYRFDLDSRTARNLYLPIEAPPVASRSALTSAGQRFGPPDFSENNVLVDIRERGTDWGAGVNLGVLWRMTRWSAGAAYRYAPTFHYDAITTIGPAGERVPFYRSFVGQVFDEERVAYNVPDMLALGFAVRPIDTLVIALEFDHVRYSQLSENTAEVFGIEENNPVQGREIAELIRTGLKFPDANQFRFGAEYTIVRTGRSIALRAGAWIDPDHRMRFERDEPRLNVLFRPGDDEFHVAPGIGFVFERFQIDAALDLSKRLNTLAISTVYRF